MPCSGFLLMMVSVKIQRRRDFDNFWNIGSFFHQILYNIYLICFYWVIERNDNLIGYKDINVFFLELFSIKLIHLFDQYLTQFMWPLNPIQSMFFRMKKWIYRLIIPRLFLNLSNYTLWWLVREMES